MFLGLHTLSVKLLLEVQSLLLFCVKAVHFLESVLGKTGLLGGGGQLFGVQSGLVEWRELLFVHKLFFRNLFVLSRTLH